MNRSIFISIVFPLFLFFSDVSAQQLSKDQMVLNPYVDHKEAYSQESAVFRRYDPFDDATMFTPVIGAQVYDDENFTINMFSMAAVEGDVTKYKTDMDLSLILSAYSSGEIQSLAGGEIIFLVNGNRYVKSIGEQGAVIFQDHQLFFNLALASNVRARIDGENKNYEIDMSDEVRSLMNVLLKELDPE